MRNKTILITGLMLLSLALAACGSVAAAQAQQPTPAGENANPPRTLSVNGSGRVFLAPDIAYINIGVHTEDKSAEEAIASNNTQAQRVVDALQRLGIDAKDIQTTNFSIYPQQQYDPNGRPTGEITYLVDNIVYVTLRNLDNIGEVLDGAIKAGANSINGIQFDILDKSAAMTEARKAAIADARAQADELAQAAGVTLGSVQSINAYGGSYPPQPVFRSDVAMAAQEAAAVPISTGQLTLTVEVSIVYEIR